MASRVSLFSAFRKRPTQVACGAALAIAMCGINAHADSAVSLHSMNHGPGAGDWLFDVGWFHFTTLDSSQPLQTVISAPVPKFINLPTTFTNSGTSSSINDSDTLALVVSYFFTDHLGVQFIGGFPAKFQVTGAGEVQPFGASGPGSGISTINLGAPGNNPLGSTWQWSPTIDLQYQFFSPSRKLRPFLGLGLSYTWFTNSNINPNLANELNQKYGNALAILAGKPGLAASDAQASPSWVPAFGAGACYMFNHHWGVIASLSYLPLHTREIITTKASDGTVLMTNSSDYKVDPLVSGLSLRYHF